MRTLKTGEPIKLGWGTRVLLKNGQIANVVEVDDEPPYTIKVFIKDYRTGVVHTRWIPSEDIAKVL
jgi:hypothetical protein